MIPNRKDSSARVLIVDDDRALLESLPQTLRLHIPHIKVDTADCGSTALTQIANIDYHAVVCDIHMPDLNGLVLLKEIRRSRPCTPTLMMTAHEEQKFAVAALRDGAYDFIAKPIDQEHLIVSLNRAIQTSDADRQALQLQRSKEACMRDLQRMIEERIHELLDTKASKDRFLAILAHELRNPLAPIHHAVELLRLDNGAPPSERAAYDIIRRQIGHISRLLDDLLDVSRIEHGKIRLERQPVEIMPIIKHAIKASMPLIATLHHELHIDAPEYDLRVEGDETRLEQIIVSLLNNAAKYTEPGGRIEISVHHDDQSVIIKVRDTGIGIDSNMIARVFDLFVQAEQALDRTQGGLGIGLTLVRHLVHLHGGEVHANSAGHDQGSEFTVTLPLLGVANTVRLKRHGGEAQHMRAHTGRHILIIEDNADSRVMLGELLKLWGHWPDLAADGHAGIEAAERMLPDVALIDIGLPGIDGYEVARQIRALPGGASTYLVALTGYGQPDDRRRCLEAGFDAHLIKPVKMEELLRVLTVDCITS
ncbi:MAG: response regulator [Chromatiales bacterium]|jgi:signal transduction histidine kinase|nr:response regulator [Chromatiales bacterium]